MQVFGYNLHINEECLFDPSLPLFVDVETDEQDNCVGIGYTQLGTKDVYYSTTISDHLRHNFPKLYLIGHNIKFDLKLLQKWGIKLTSANVLHDTMLMSYCIYGSSRSHSLKALASELCGMEWKTYKEITSVQEEKVSTKKFETTVDDQGKKRRIKLDSPQIVRTYKTTRTTLDHIPTEQVAEYCCSDVIATSKLYQTLNNGLVGPLLSVYQDIELPTMRTLFDMENRGILLDVEKLRALDTEVTERLVDILKSCEQYAPGINIGSSKQLAPILVERGFWLPETSKGNKSTKKAVLERYKGDPFIDLLLEYSQLKKLSTSFMHPLLELPTLPRVYPTFNQVRYKDEELSGISTGRLSCANPNLQQIPRRSHVAKKVRELFIPDTGKVLVVADFSQVEPRVLAHLSGDEYLQDVFNTGKDMYVALIKGTKWEHLPEGREIGKTFYLALSYGAQAKKLAGVFKCSVEEAQRMMDKCWENIPKVREWQRQTIADARTDGYVETLYGRKRFLPEAASKDFYLRASAERKAINTPVQGTAADIMKIAMNNLSRNGYPIQLVVHDEVILSVNEEDVELAIDDIKRIMETSVKLAVPLKVEIQSGGNWNAAKEKEESNEKA